MRVAGRDAAHGLLALVLASACSFGANADGNATVDDSGGSSSTTGGPGMVEYEVCGAAGSNSVLDELGQCFCLLGYTWNNPYDPRDFGCSSVEPRMVPCEQACDASAIVVDACEPPGTHSCDCADGQRWCYPPPEPGNDTDDEPLDTRCCTDHAQPQPGTSDTGTSSADADASGSSDGSTSGAAVTSSEGSSGGSTAAGTSEQ